MGILRTLFGKVSPDRWALRLGASVQTDAGVEVTPDTAMSSTAVFAGVRLLAQSLATVPLNVHQADGRVRRIAQEHPLHRVLHDQWNPELTAAEGRSILLANAVSLGNGYAEVVRDGGGRVRELWPLWPHRCRPGRVGGELVYHVAPVDGPPVTLPASRVLHLRGFGLGGLVGEDVLQRMQEAVGLTLAAERFAASFFGSGLNPGGVLEHPSSLSNEAQKRLTDAWSGGLKSAHRVKILEEGMTFKPLSVPPDAAQFLETRQHQVREVSRMLNVPPHMLADLSRATHSNVEHQGIEFVRYSLLPWAVRLEARLGWLLSPEERRRGYYVRHNLEGLLRGAASSRYEAHRIGRAWGWLSPNDVREREDMNPIEGGDRYLVPLNMTPVKRLAAMRARVR